MLLIPLRRCTMIVVILSSIAMVAETASSVLPNTKPGVMAGQWLAICKSHDVNRMSQWYASNVAERLLKLRPAAAMAKDKMDTCSANGGFVVGSVAQSSADKLQLIARAMQTKMWADIRVSTDAAGKVERLTVDPTFPPETAMPRNLSDAEISKELKSSVEGVSKAGLFSGIVEIARGTQTIATATGGYANRDKKSSITGSTQFTLGSLGKMFTAAAIGQLVDEGKLSFEDTVGSFFPNFGNETVRNKVTVGMLLSHTSGMGDFLRKRTPEMMKNGVKRASEFMALYENDAPQFEPGKGWAYSNAGLALAGAIVEKVSGEAYPDYIRKHVFEVAGMRNSDPNNIPHSDPRLVTPYTTFTPTGPTDWHEAEHDIGSPAGGAISTADDLIRFADALRSGKLVSAKTLQQMATPHGQTPGGAKYGYAMDIQEVYGKTVVGHGGGFPGVSTHLYLLLGSPYTVVVLANQDPPADERAGLSALAMAVKKSKQQ